MGQFLLLLVVALTVAAVVFGVTVLVSGRDPGLVPAEPDGRSVPLPGARPLDESDVTDVRFDTALRGYRMGQVDAALRRAAYDIGYKSELIGVLEAENVALREGRTEDADALRRAREEAVTATLDADPTSGDPVTIDLSAPDSPARRPTRARSNERTAASPAGAAAGAATAFGADEAPASGPAAETGAPSRAATGSEAGTPSRATASESGAAPDTAGGSGGGAAEAGVAEAPAAAAVEDTTSPADAVATGPGGIDDRERGPAVRSESA
ncbi:DivIVA domain-containing protein [Micromonospora robiginosa]|uniref:DivIVA domain-containing protein n=1 Tax=Micromonospora robiginosa TaxID=2749844 RepID=A0A7L6BB04_9ACTN|nr:DivIVA domain-containing protein [Micromonospora ferruginea]QLQ39113.1 DivIVA domain-containing protein [Micromonospora ferruginea]